MKSKLVVVVGFIAFAGSLVAITVLRGSSRGAPVAEDFAHATSVTALYAAPNFSLTSHRNEAVSTESLAGQPYVVNFIFTTCRTVCPALTAHLVQLQRALPDARLAFLSVSVDPDNDTPEALAAYARRWNPKEPRWHLLATTDATLESLKTGFRITAQKTDGGVDAIMHSAVFLVVDGHGVVRGAFDVDDADDRSALLRKLRELAPSEPVRTARSGETLFHELSCTTCHEDPALAPPLGGLVGRSRQLESALVVTADEAYLRESILSPQAKRVRGYPLAMPSYAGLLTSEELTALVAYVRTLPEALPETTTVAVDPVCHMKVRVTDTALHAALDGGTETYFCSAWCRARFLENPEAYGH